MDEWSRASVEYIEKTFESIKTRISKIPENEEELVDLKEFIQVSKDKTQFELLALNKDVEKHYELLDKFSF